MSQNHHAILEKFASVRVLCLGDVMLDRYIYGAVSRVSQEAPIPILKGERTESMLGGAGNVTRNLQALGARVQFLTVVGCDHAGEEVRRLGEEMSGVEMTVLGDDARPTTVKSRYVAAGQQLLRVDEERPENISPALEEELIARATALMGEVDVVVLSDYAKGVFTDRVLRGVIEAANQAAKPVIADPKRSDLSAYNGVTILKPNLAELALAVGDLANDDAAVERAARDLLATLTVEALLVSRSARGMSLVPAQGSVRHLGAQARQVFDVSGAGDTVNAVMAAALGAGADLGEAALLANTAGGIVVQKSGTAVVTVGELADALLAGDIHRPEGKIMQAEAAADRVKRWRAAGMKVGFTNGCFDLLHPGHITLIQDARAQCERLIVAINADASVQKLKGPGRPVQNEAARSLVLAAMSAVDMVVVFEEETPIPLLQLLQPDLLIKGGDYDLDGVVGADVVRAYGGQVRVSRHVEGEGTTGMISRMNG